MSRLSPESLEDRDVPSVTNPTPVGLTPAEVRHAYGFDQIPGLTGGYNTAAGAGQTIAIVMAGDDPYIVNDLRVFDQTFGLPDPTLVKLNENGKTTGPFPQVNASDAGEIALDVEWSHAIAPAAKIVLVEANSFYLSDLVPAINTARSYPGASVVSMSWGILQGPAMSSYEQYFATPAGHTPVTFVAATLDNGQLYPAGLYWPAVSPRVLAVGGTSLTIADATGTYGSETAWGASTGGITPYFAQPTYQQGVVNQTTTGRAVPDVSFHADNSVAGFAVYDTVRINGQTGWFNAYGDSAGAQEWGGLVAVVNGLRATSGLPTLDGPTQLLPGLYTLASTGEQTYFHDITTGANGAYSAGPGYDLVTGLGTPRANVLVPALAALTGSGASVTFSPPPPAQPAVLSGAAQLGGGLTAHHALVSGGHRGVRK